MGRPPTVSSVNVQLKPVISSHDVGSIHVPFAFEEMSSGVEHTVGVLVADEDVEDALEVTVEVPVGRVDVTDASGPRVVGTDAEVVEDELGLSAAAPVAGVEFVWTLMTFFAIRAPTTAPVIAKIAMTPAIHNPTKY
jgi:hypothetical protein